MPSLRPNPENESLVILGSPFPIGGGDPRHGGARTTDNQTSRISSVFKQGQVLDSTYRIVDLIGEGGMGVVYEATHERLAGRYAIKVLLQRLSDDPEAMARFDREARITSSLQHPNIVQVVDFNRLTDGTEYLVMEYLQGETLAERLRRVGALPTAVVVDIVEQIAAGLAAAHSHGVVHRDLKPENIFLLPVEGRHVELVKVLDFGISKINDANRGFLRPESAVMGTPEYMSPEQCQGQPGNVDAASDQFALAAITYEMLTGRTPFSGRSLAEVLTSVIHDNPAPMGIAPEIERIVGLGLTKSKGGRFPSVTAFAEALRGAAVGPPGGAYETYAIAEPFGETRPTTVSQGDRSDGQRQVQRRRGRGWGALLFAMAAAGVAVYFVVGVQGVAWTTLPFRPPRPILLFAQVPRGIEVRPIGRGTSTEGPARPTSPQVASLGEMSPVALSPTATSSATVSPAVIMLPVALPRTALSPGVAATNRRRGSVSHKVAKPAPTGWSQAVSRPPAWHSTISPDENATLPLNETYGDAP
jgi:serine/threonine protein kinase